MSIIPTSIALWVTPKTKTIAFESLISGVDDATKNTLSGITNIRKEFVEALSTSSTYTMTSGEQYLPYLYGLIEKLPDKSISIASLTSAWTSSISEDSITFFSSKQWHFEVVSTLMAIALAHRERAAELLSLAMDDSMFAESKSDISQFLCKAAGIFDYIREVELFRWGEKPVASIPEKHAETYMLLTTLSLAETQQLAVKFAVHKKMGSGLIAKLCIDIRDKYLYIEGLLGTLDMLSKRLPDYIRMNAAVFDLLAHRFQAATHLENNEYGKSIGFLKRGIERANAVNVPWSFWSSNPGLEELKEQFKKNKDQVTSILESETRTNSTLYYQPVPEGASLAMPLGASLAKVLPYHAPEPLPIDIKVKEGWGCLMM